MESSTSKTKATSHSEKKLKQARLPFQIIRVSPKESVPACKKLKLDNDLKSPLTNDLETKENIKVESDKKENLEEKSISQDDNDDDSVQLIESIHVEKSPEKSESERLLAANSSDEKDNNACPTEVNSATNIQSKENMIPSLGDSQPELLDKSETVYSDSEKTVKSAVISDASKRKISDQDGDKENNKNKKAKLDYKNKLSIFAKKDCGTKAEEIISNKAENGREPENCETNSNDNNIKEPRKNNNKNNTEIEDASTEVDNNPNEVIIVDDEKCSSNKGETNKSNHQDKVPSTSRETAEGSPRHIIFHDFDAKVSSSSDDVGPVTPKSKKPPEEGSQKKSVKKLTPKQLQKEAESAKKRQERERLLEERRKKKEDELEEKRRKKEEKEEERKRLKEEKEKKRQMEIDQKNEEKKKKDEEKRKKEEQRLEEKRKKEEELQRKKEEENQQKKKFTKEAAAFSNFFKKVEIKSEPAVQTENKSTEETKFMPFMVKPDMRLAPINRNPMDQNRLLEFEKLYCSQSVEKTYLTELRSKVIEPKKSGNTWPLEEKFEDVLVIEEEIELNDSPNASEVPEQRRKNTHAKLLLFHENRRPPYWGTWRKKSKNITARRPFGKDTVFDYEVDSDDEWEEEEPGESLHGSDDEKEPEDDYEVDNDFFVPHGYLSDDENPEDETLTPETQKAKLKLLGEQFDLERNEKTKQLRPITVGCIWFKNDSDEPENVNSAVIKLLNKRKAVLWVESKPIILHKSEESAETSDVVSQSTTPSSSKKVKFPESAVPFLINMLHGNTCSRKNIIQKFLMNWKDEESQLAQGDSNANLLTKTCITKKIKLLSAWQEYPDEGPLFGRLCWYVKKEFREKYGLNDLPVPNKWDGSAAAAAAAAAAGDGNLDSAKKDSPALITKFTKILTEEERKSQLNIKSKARKSINTSELKPPSEGKKSAKKLLHFWSKPQSQNQNSTTEDMEVCVINQQEVVQEKKKGANGSVRKSNEIKIEEIVIDNDSDTPETEKLSTELPQTKKSDPEGEKIHEKIDQVTQKYKNTVEVSVPTQVKLETIPAISNPDEGTAGVKEKLNDQSGKLLIKDNPIVNKVEIETKKPTEVSKTETLAPSTSSQTNGNSKPVVKKRVPILFSAPRGCEILKSNTDEKDKLKKENGTSTNKETPNDKEQKVSVRSNSGNDSVKPAEGLQVETSAMASNSNTISGNPKPVVKKRVPILFSAPRGCDIKKPISNANESQKTATD